MTCGIYKIENNINGKVYIGQSKQIEKRWISELNGDCNEHLKYSFKKYGKCNFSFSIIEECDKNFLSEKEIFYISQFKSHIREFGYNKTMGGDYVYPNEETRLKMSISASKRKASEETKKKLSIIRTGKVKANSKTVYQYDCNYNLIETYKRLTDAAIHTGINKKLISNNLQGYKKTCKGFIFSFNINLEKI